MSEKIYLNNTQELVKTAQSGQKVFMEYRNREEEFEDAQQFEIHDWDFTLGLYARLSPNDPVKFFKRI